MQQHILIVDDIAENIQLAGAILSSAGHRVSFAQDGDKALELAYTNHYDLILLDIMMPDIDGYEVCQRLRTHEKTKNTPILFLTAHNDSEVLAKAFESGGTDYLSKPINRVELLSRIKSHLKAGEYRKRLIQAQKDLEEQNLNLEEKVRERTEKIQQIQEVTILSLAALAESKDHETGNHIMRTREYVKTLIQKALQKGLYPNELNEETGDTIYKSSPLHDIGKVGIPDAILNKPAKLSKEEFEIMKKHTEIGAGALRAARESVGLNDYLVTAEEIALYHHEKWDGSGYPKGLKGKNIPIPGRIMAIADVYDALITDRVYKNAIPHKEAVQMILKEQGKGFDPDLIEIFKTVQCDFEEIALTYKDELGKIFSTPRPFA